MNRVFKTKWSAAHQQYVVTDEHHATKGKSSKSAVALAVAAMMLAAGSASAAYMEAGFRIQDSSAESVQSAISSWQTAEYKKDWGLEAMGAANAYALGFNGSSVTVGVMDSGALLQKHPDLAGDRFSATHITGQYSTTGNRYPQGALEQFEGNYKAGDKYDVTGDWKLNVNDSHGTHVLGTVGANRDGNQFHGVAWGANIISGNTGGTDDSNYGPFLDPGYFLNAWTTLADAVNEGNNGRGGVINNSFGTNTRIAIENKPTTDAEAEAMNTKLKASEGERHHTWKKDSKGNWQLYGPDNGSVSVHFPVDTAAQSEYEYFLFNNVYGKDADGKLNKNFVDSAWEAVKGKKVVQVMTTGNRDIANPFFRPNYPYFNPEAENQWIAVAGLKQSADGKKLELIKTFNEAGTGKWWTLTAPGSAIYSSAVVEGSYVEPGSGVGAGKQLGDYTYAAWSGTSMAAPHVTGAFGVLLSRYAEMDALQVREVLLTTAKHTNTDGSLMEGWVNTDGTTPLDGQVSDRMGWGVPDLNKGMYGPGQLLSNFEYNMKGGSLDVWSNNISAVALAQRKAEDAAWKAAAEKWMADPKLKLDNSYTAEQKKLIGDIILTSPDTLKGIGDKKTVAEADAIQWRKDYFQKRIDAINARTYKGSLVKMGEGTLVMTGNNTYEGTTTVKGGKLLAFAESIGTDNKVTVEGGTFGVLEKYDDKFTMKGELESAKAGAKELVIDIKNGGSLYIDAASTVAVDQVHFAGDKKVVVGLAGANADDLLAVYNGENASATVAGKFTANNGATAFAGLTADNVVTDSLFFEFDSNALAGDTLTVKMKKKADTTFESFAKTENQRRIATAIAASGNDLTANILASTNGDSVTAVYSALDDDFYATARNGLVMNTTAVSQAVMDQVRGMGEGRSAEIDNGRARIWAAGIGHWGEADGTKSTMDVDFRTGFLGAEAIVVDNTKVGAFFGYGTSDYKSGLSKIDADDMHFGIYGLTDIADATITYGVAYTDEDRDTKRALNGAGTAHSEKASVLQGFVEGSYNFDLSVAKVSPYVGFTWAHVKADGATDVAMGQQFKTADIKDDIQIATLGVRTSMPFMMGAMPVAVKADLGWSHYFGDTEAVANVQMGADGQFAKIEGNELKDQFNVGLGITGQVAKHATVGVSYSGAFGNDIKTHGIFANVRFNF